MDSAAEDLLAGFHQNNLWRDAALLTTGTPGGFFLYIKLKTIFSLLKFYTELSLS